MTTEIPTRMRHLGVCAHAQTPYARRVCRKATLAALTAPAVPAYQAGDEIDVDGVTVTLCRSRGNNGIRWTWLARESDLMGESYQTTPEAAIDAARRTLGGARCACGEPATMRASLRHTCPSCYDRYAA